tara:strand:- start:194 stop:433 length:240 start_codon:yes stop_codon:yes gene_type:complete
MTTKKTAVIFEFVPENTKFYVVDGDFSHLNGVMVNVDDYSELTEECAEFIPTGQKELTIQDIKQAVLDGAELIHCGYYM